MKRKYSLAKKRQLSWSHHSAAGCVTVCVCGVKVGGVSGCGLCSLDLVVTSEIYLVCQLCMSGNAALRNDSERIEAG